MKEPRFVDSVGKESATSDFRYYQFSPNNIEPETCSTDQEEKDITRAAGSLQRWVGASPTRTQEERDEEGDALEEEFETALHTSMALEPHETDKTAFCKAAHCTNEGFYEHGRPLRAY